MVDSTGYKRFRCDTQRSELFLLPGNITGHLYQRILDGLDGYDGPFWHNSGSGYVPAPCPDSARDLSVLRHNYTGEVSGDFEIWISEAFLKPRKPGDKIPLDIQIPKPVIDLMTVAPLNPAIRGLILKYVKKSPPDNCKTFPQLKEWIELNGEGYVHNVSEQTAPSPPTNRNAFTVLVDVSENRSGTARYSCHASIENAEYILTENDVSSVATETIARRGNLDALVERLNEIIQENATSVLELEESDFEYDRHDYDGGDDTEVSTDQDDLRDSLMEFLSGHHPDLLQQLTR